MSRKGDFERGGRLRAETVTVRGEARRRICSTVAMVRTMSTADTTKTSRGSPRSSSQPKKSGVIAEPRSRPEYTKPWTLPERAHEEPELLDLGNTEGLANKRKDRGSSSWKKWLTRRSLQATQVKPSCRGLWPRGTIAAPAHVFRRPIRRF